MGIGFEVVLRRLLTRTPCVWVSLGTGGGYSVQENLKEGELTSCVDTALKEVGYPTTFPFRYSEVTNTK